LVETDPARHGQGTGSDHLRIRFFRDDSVREVPFVEREVLLDLLRRLGVKPDGALVLKGGRSLPLDDPVPLGDLTIIDVRSGG